MDQQKSSPLLAEYRLLAGLSLGLFLLALGATSFFDLTHLVHRPWRAFVKASYFCLMLASSLSLLFSITSFLRRGYWPRFMARISLLAASQGLVFGIQLVPYGTLAPHLQFALISLLYACPLFISLSLRMLPSALPKSLDRLITIVGSVVGLVVILSFWQEAMEFNLETTLWNVGISLALLTLCIPLLTTGLQIYFHRTKILLDHSWALSKLSPWNSTQSYESLFVSILLANSLGNIIFLAQVKSHLMHDIEGPPIYWANFQFVALFTLVWSFRTWYLVTRIPRRFHTPFLMERARAGQLFQSFWVPMNHKNRRNIGYRTAVVIIDHDPHEDCRSQLPAILFRSRQIQCEQIIRSTFHDMLLSMESHTAQITLALDNTQQSTPCTQALLILAILHLDGLRMIENRLRLLAKLFPLLDPDLADHVDISRLDQLFAKLTSFFYLDYNWVDQSWFALGDDAYLDIRLEKLNLSERQNVLAQLRSAQWLGNFIWISDAAFERLTIESPFLSPIMETINIRLESNPSRKGSYAIHLIKFENVIPRLQRYFDLESYRAKLASYPVTQENSRILSNLRSTLEFDGGISSLQYVLQEIEQHDFIGFKAKDAALDILLTIVKRAESLYTTKRLNEHELELVFQQCKTLVQSIGYPSQDLHQSHLRKLEIREYQQLLVYGRDPQHPRCEEAWLFLSSLPQKKLQGDFGRRALDLIRNVTENSELYSHSFILRKATETFFLVAHAQLDSSSHWKPLLDPLARLVIRDTRKGTLIQTFMDQKVALDIMLGETLNLGQNTALLWQRWVEDLLMEHESDENMKQTLALRWRSFSQGQSIKLVS